MAAAAGAARLGLGLGLELRLGLALLGRREDLAVSESLHDLEADRGLILVSAPAPLTTHGSIRMEL